MKEQRRRKFAGNGSEHSNFFTTFIFLQKRQVQRLGKQD